MTTLKHWPTLVDFSNDMKSKYFWINDNLLPPTVVQPLLALAKNKYSENEFRPGKIGKGQKKELKESIRSDEILWIEDWSADGLFQAKHLLDVIMHLARHELFLPIKRYESHFTVYRPGAQYKRHCDQHKFLPSRILTCVIYLSDWAPNHGGQLIIYDENLSPVIIEPKPGRVIVFDSRLEHEVKPVYKTRWSLTSWLRNDIHHSIHL